MTKEGLHGVQSGQLSRKNIESLLSTPEPELITLSHAEHDEAVRMSLGTKQIAEMLLDGNETGDFLDSQANPIHIRTASVLTNAELQIDRWVRNRDKQGQIIIIDFQSFEFTPELVVLTSSSKDFFPNSTSPAIQRNSVRREANQDDLRVLTSALSTSAPKTE